MFPRSVVAVFLLPLASYAEVPARIDFQRDVRPLFEKRCFGCHGPEQQMANFRLDRRRDALRGGSIVVIAPGSSSASRLFHKISGTRYGQRMPPTGPLSDDEIEIIKRWLDQGAVWPDAVSGDVPQRSPDAAAARMIEALRHG